MSRVWHLSLRFVLLLGLLLPLTSAQAQSPGVSEARFARLARGVNLPLWFWYGPEDPADMAGHFTPSDFELIRAMGFTHVRIPINLGTLADSAGPRPEVLAVLDEALAQIVAADLAAIVDLHSLSLADSDAANYSGALETDDALVEDFIAFWEGFGAHLAATTDPEWVFIEPMNEPVFESNPARWYTIQRDLVAAIRAVAPEHTILATSTRWSNLDTILTMEPLDDPNIVYNFHFYEPFLFTHQGATWSWDAVRNLRDLPYPSSPEAVEPIAERISDATIQGYVRGYGQERWDADRIADRIGLAAAWGAQHGVRVTCNEFGALKTNAPEDSRVRWTHDLRLALEEAGIGWAMWEYDSGFGLVLRSGNMTLIDGPLAEALGLTPPALVVTMD